MKQKSDAIPLSTNLSIAEDPERLTPSGVEVLREKGPFSPMGEQVFGVISDRFRELTKELARATFGMDVQGYRKYKFVVNLGNRHIELSNRARLRPSELANAAKDMHNSTFSPPG